MSLPTTGDPRPAPAPPAGASTAKPLPFLLKAVLGGVLAVFVLVSLLMWGLCITMWIRESRIARTWKPTTATVTQVFVFSVQTRGTPDGKPREELAFNYRYFDAEGRPQVGMSRMIGPRKDGFPGTEPRTVKLGDTLPCYFDPANPADSALDPSSGHVPALFGFATVSTILCAGLASFAFRKRK